MIEDKKISVIVNCYNGEKYLEECIDSILNQTYKNIEIIFWDNKSNDSSKKLLTQYNDNRIKYFLAKEHTTLGKARNLAIQKATGEFIAFLDVDDIWLSQKLEKQILAFKDQTVGIVASNTIFFNKKKQKVLYRHKQKNGYIFKELLENYNLSLETVVIRRSALNNQDQWFDERFSAIEECDLFLRISYDWKVIYINEVLAKWRIHSESLTWKKPLAFSEEKELMLEKFGKLYNNFEINYKNQIEKIRNGSMLERVIYFWKNGESYKSRIELRKIKKFSLKNTLLYILTFLKYKWCIKLINLKWKITP
jgi:glycosyltransferase involved in cell wall biosynthesis